MAVQLPTFNKIAGQLGQLGPRSRKILRYAGFVLIGLVTFIFAFQLVFPFHRVKDKIVDALAEKYDVTIGSVDGGLIPGRMHFKALSIRTRPTAPDDTVTTFFVESLEVDLGLFALLRGAASVKLDAKIGPGHIRGSIALSRGHTSIDLVGEDLPSASLPVREIVGLPMSGKLEFSVALELPNERNKSGKLVANWPEAEGVVTLACPTGCTVGDGKAKLKPKLANQRNQAMVSDGIDFGKINIDTLSARVDIKEGRVTVSKLDTKSPDGQLNVDFVMTLSEDINSSLVTGCLRFNGSEALLRREAKTHAAISTTGAPLGPDNLFHIKLDGPLRQVRRLPALCGPSVNTNMDNPAPRPSLTITPENAARPTPGPQVPPSPTPIAPMPPGMPQIPPGETPPNFVAPPSPPPGQANPVPDGSGVPDPSNPPPPPGIGPPQQIPTGPATSPLGFQNPIPVQADPNVPPMPQQVQVDDSQPHIVQPGSEQPHNPQNPQIR